MSNARPFTAIFVELRTESRAVARFVRSLSSIIIIAMYHSLVRVCVTACEDSTCIYMGMGMGTLVTIIISWRCVRAASFYCCCYRFSMNRNWSGKLR